MALITSNQRSHAYDFQVQHGHAVPGDRPLRPPARPPDHRHAGSADGRPEAGRAVSDGQWAEARPLREALRPAHPGLTRALPGSADRRPQALLDPRAALPQARKVTFGADYAFEGRPTIRKRREINCKRFLRRPTAKRRGAIPGA